MTSDDDDDDDGGGRGCDVSVQQVSRDREGASRASQHRDGSLAIAHKVVVLIHLVVE